MSDWETETNVTHETEIPRPDEIARDRPCLVVLSGSRVGTTFHLERSVSVLGRGHRSDFAIDDDGVSRGHARVRRDLDAVWIEDLDSRNGTFVNGVRLSAPLRLADGDKVQLGRGTILKFTYHDDLDDSYQERMIESALRDPLTRVYNKRYLDERLDAELRFARRHDSQLGLLMIDVDHFKAVNDQRGHLVGDAVLVAVAQALTRAIRNEDVVARYGGEELVVLTREIDSAGAGLLGERLRKVIAELVVPTDDGPPVQITVSVGVAVFPEVDADTPAQLVDAADKAMYRAKAAGRNQVRLAEVAAEPEAEVSNGR